MVARSPIRYLPPKPVDHVDDFTTGRPNGQLDPFPCDMSSSLHDMDSVTWNHDFSNGGYLSLDVKPASVATRDTTLDDNAARNLISRLDTFHERARDSILSAPEPEQASMTNAYANWALHVSRDPLGGNDLHPDCTDKEITEAFGMGQSAIV
jgi:hypothetical protein